MPIPEGLFLRPDGDPNTKVYSNGKGLLQAGKDASTEAMIIGRFDHDDALSSDDPSVTYSHTLAKTSSDFAISNNNQLSFIGANSAPPYTLSIESTKILALNLSDDFAGRINADASNDTEDADTRIFYFEGGTMSNIKAVDAVNTAVTGVKASLTIRNINSPNQDLMIITANNTGTDANDLPISISASSAVYSGSFSSTNGFAVDVHLGVQGFGMVYGTFGGAPTLDELITSIENYPLEDIVNYKAETFAFLLNGETGTFADLFTITKADGADGTSNAFEIAITDNLLAGGVDDKIVDVAHRSLAIAEGKIYVTDANTGRGKIISFRAMDDLRIYETSYVIVSDNGDGTGLVSAVATLPDGDDFYVLGRVDYTVDLSTETGIDANETGEALTIKLVTPAVEAKLRKNTNLAIFTATTAGVKGNHLSITFTASGQANKDVVVAFVEGSTTNIEITYGEKSEFIHLNFAFREGTLDEDIFALFNTNISIGRIPLNTVFTDGATEFLSGGTASTIEVTHEIDGTSQQEGPYQWIIESTLEKTEDYILNLAP